MSYSHDVEVPTEDGTGTETVTLQFPSAAEMPAGVMRRTRKSPDPFEAMWSLLEWALPEEHLAVVDRLTLDKIEPIITAWTAAEEKQQADQDKPVGPPKTKKPE